MTRKKCRYLVDCATAKRAPKCRACRQGSSPMTTKKKLSYACEHLLEHVNCEYFQCECSCHVRAASTAPEPAQAQAEHAAQAKPCIRTVETGKHKALGLHWVHQANAPFWYPKCPSCGWIDLDLMVKEAGLVKAGNPAQAQEDTGCPHRVPCAECTEHQLSILRAASPRPAEPEPALEHTLGPKCINCGERDGGYEIGNEERGAIAGPFCASCHDEIDEHYRSKAQPTQADTVTLEPVSNSYTLDTRTLEALGHDWGTPPNAARCRRCSRQYPTWSECDGYTKLREEYEALRREVDEALMVFEGASTLMGHMGSVRELQARLIACEASQDTTPIRRLVDHFRKRAEDSTLSSSSACWHTAANDVEAALKETGAPR